MKRLLVVLGLAIMLAVAGWPAHAGTGAATLCDDQQPLGDTKVPVFNDPVLGHLTIEVGGPPNVHVAICYSDRPSGTPSALYGGFAFVSVNTNGTVQAFCVEDSSALVKCNGTLAYGAISPADLPALKTTAVCGLYALGACRLFIDAPSIVLFGGAPATTLTILNSMIVNDPGTVCVGLAGCP